MRRDAAAPVAGSCASLWACTSPRSRRRAPPAPWLWFCPTCWGGGVGGGDLWTAAGYGYRCSHKVDFTRDSDPCVPGGWSGGDFYCVRCSDLPHALSASAACLPTVQVRRRWEWFICGLCQPEGGRSKTGERDYPTPRRIFHNRRGKWKQRYLRIVWIPPLPPPPPFSFF